MKLEVVVVPVADVDRAKNFYQALGWREDADYAAGGDFRVVQLTPPGSACSIIFGTGITSAQMSEVFHDAGGVFHHAEPRDGWLVRLRTIKATARLPRSATRTAMAG